MKMYQFYFIIKILFTIQFKLKPKSKDCIQTLNNERKQVNEIFDNINEGIKNYFE